VYGLDPIGSVDGLAAQLRIDGEDPPSVRRLEVNFRQREAEGLPEGGFDLVKPVGWFEDLTRL
jgi:hypothetical protein